MALVRTVGTSEAARILGRSVPYLRYLGLSGRLPVVRRRPTMRFNRAAVEMAKGLFPVNPNERRGRPRLPTAVKVQRVITQEGL